jgi:hypothetical protein
MNPQVIESQENMGSVLDGGKGFEFPLWDSSFRAYYATVPEINLLHEQQGFRTLTIAGVEPAGITDEKYKKLTGIQRKLWLDLLVKISEESTIVGASCHILYIGEKGDK